jgi:RNA polymerase sigma-70 factor, ECF subfamily
MSLTSEDFAQQVAPLRPGLLLHCYRMLGSSHDAEDAVQETLLRGWRAAERFEGRSSLRTWLYTVATNVCLREIERRGRRLSPVDLGPASDPADGLAPPLTETVWLGPLPGAGLTWESTPADAVYEQREAVELAFIAALQRLPALQRAVLVLREVLAFSAAETAEILETSTDSVTSALARARGSLRAELPQRSQQEVLREVGDEQVRATVTAFVAAWERNDVDAVVALLAEDVEMSMPPYAEWYRGRADVATFLRRTPLRSGRRWRAEPATANGQPAVAFSVWDERIRAFLSHGLSVLTFDPAGAITGFTSFLDPRFVATVTS